jgi:hypothetical protein
MFFSLSLSVAEPELYRKLLLPPIFRIAPTCPPIGELTEALEIFCAAVKLASAEKYLSGKKIYLEL